jgi:transcriptional regulator with XRE-family HTH domain
MARKECDSKGMRPHREQGDRLKAFREARCPELSSHVPYARAAGIDSHAYRRNENGKSLISVDNALRLRKRYEISLDWIYAGDYRTLPYTLAHEMFAWLRRRNGSEPA